MENDVIMRTVEDLCKPRPSVFEDAAGDDVPDITIFLNGTIGAERFFFETFRTRGMELQAGFLRSLVESDHV